MRTRVFSIPGLAAALCCAVTLCAADAGPYTKWLNEDVVYLVQPAERQALERLAPDQERERFIAQFWLRRDPTPDTEANELKQEHYRRIAYANQLYSGQSAGWKTDWGRTYIVYGPADELESHPSGTPTEKWLYRYIEGVGPNVVVEFVDASNSGAYRMTPGPLSRRIP